MYSNVSNLIPPTKLPEGYSQRPAALKDAEAVAQMCNTIYQSRSDADLETAEEILRDWQSPGWDFTTSTQVFLNPAGEVIGYAAVREKTPAHQIIAWDVLLDSHWQIVSQAALAWAEQRALQSLYRCPPEERFAPSMACYAHSPNQVLIESQGYKATRYFYEMQIDFQGEYIALPMTEGFSLRVVDYPNDLEKIVTLYDETWRNYYSYIKRPIADTMTEWKQSIDTSVTFDPSMWYFIVEDSTQEAIGFVLCGLRVPGYEHQGVINRAGLREAYRHRGIARTTLSQLLAEFQRRGKKGVGLTTSTNNDVTRDVTSMYESVGMRHARSLVRLEKEMRPGVERMVV
jgi:ribosomal protein S18 acetylase RimI-like enzyme